MPSPPKQKPSQLTEDELSFQRDSDNWRYGPVFSLQFDCGPGLDFSSFEQALLSDRMRLVDSRFDSAGRVILWHESWPQCIGGYYYDFVRPARREPSLVFYPGQYEAIGGQDFVYGNYKGGEVAHAARLLVPLIGLASRMKSDCGARKVLLFAEHSFPEQSSETEIQPGIYLAKEMRSAVQRDKRNFH